MMFWAGLRYSDVQRVKISSLTISSGPLRGRTWKAKNAKQGSAFSCITSGLLGTHSSNWAFQWIQFFEGMVEETGATTRVAHRPRFPPSSGESHLGIPNPSPMAHFIWLRLALNLPLGFDCSRKAARPPR